MNRAAARRSEESGEVEARDASIGDYVRCASGFPASIGEQYFIHATRFDDFTPGYSMLLKSVSRRFKRSVAQYDESQQPRVPSARLITESWAERGERLTLPASRMNAEAA